MQRFWDKVHKTDGCWEWTGNRTVHGYGWFWFKGKGGSAHRASWQIHHGDIPAGLFVCHTCDNRKCVRPDHLFLGTAKDNMQDAKRKGRIASEQPGWLAKRRAGQKYGEELSQTKLTAPQVIDIRRRYARGGETYHKLASEHGVCWEAIKNVVKRRTWKHLEEVNECPISA